MGTVLSPTEWLVNLCWREGGKLQWTLSFLGDGYFSFKFSQQHKIGVQFAVVEDDAQWKVDILKSITDLYGNLVFVSLLYSDILQEY